MSRYSQKVNEIVNAVDVNDFYTNKKFQPALLSQFLQRMYRPITLKDTEEIWRYDWEHEIYRKDGEVFFKELIKRLFAHHFKRKLVVESLYDLQASTFKEREAFTLNPYLIPVKNGIVKLLQTKNKWFYCLTVNDSRKYVTSRLPVTYDPKATCPAILEFLKQLFPQQPEDITLLQEYTGYMLLRRMLFQKVLMLLGEGANGKSTLLDLIKTFIGEENVVHISIQDLCNGRWYTAELYKKLANLDSDIEAKELQHTGKFKRATGGDRLMGERKNKNPFYYKPFTKHIWSCNQIPYSYDDSEAFYRRWRIIPFKQQFKGTNCNPNILKKLKTPKEMSGFLNWALQGLIRILSQGEFSNEPPVEETKALWMRLSDPLFTFLYSGNVEWGEGERYPIQEFYRDFTSFCAEQGLRQWILDRVGKTINKKYPQIEPYYPYIEGKQVRCYTGISPKREIKKIEVLAQGKLQLEEEGW